MCPTDSTTRERHVTRNWRLRVFLLDQVLGPNEDTVAGLQVLLVSV